MAQKKSDPWYCVSNSGEISSPSLLVYPQRIEDNILKMIGMAGGPERIRPHVKTHKMAEIVALQMNHGIRKFKCATIAEAEMVAGCGAKDILFAYQPVGPNIDRFFLLMKKFPDAEFTCLADCEEVIRQLSLNAVKHNHETGVWIDINVGMDRTGAKPGKSAADLYRLISGLPMLYPEGLHVYDGHIHDSDYQLREKICNESFAPARELALELGRESRFPVKIVAGGTPTFPIHAKREGVETSPGTLVLWDYGYSSSYTDLDFLHAAVLLTRVISKPAAGLICIDLGHKAVASEMPQPRVWLPGIGKYVTVSHNEEHMVIRTTAASSMKVGDILYGIPYHICPTVDRFDVVSVVREGKVTEQWNVAARKRKITV
jgi:D-serine deaminase-like pyridoxal phosphate-dependent protein